MNLTKKRIIVNYDNRGHRENQIFELHANKLVDQIGNQPDEQVLDQVFRQCNHVDGTEWISNSGYRSMMVGDLITIVDPDTGIRIFQVEAIGWKKLTEIK
jgi:hypothetical protein